MPATRSMTIAVAAVLSGTAFAHAQSVISREISSEPVETLITQGPDGITVTRRPLQGMAPPVVSTTPVMPTYYGQAYTAAPAYSTGTVAVQPYAAAPVAVAPTTTVVDEDDSDTVTTVPRAPRTSLRSARRGTPPIMARAVESDAVPATRVRRATRRVTTTATVAPRPIVYNTIVQQNSYDPAALQRVTPVYDSVATGTTYVPAPFGSYQRW